MWKSESTTYYPCWDLNSRIPNRNMPSLLLNTNALGATVFQMVYRPPLYHLFAFFFTQFKSLKVSASVAFKVGSLEKKANMLTNSPVLWCCKNSALKFLTISVTRIGDFSQYGKNFSVCGNFKRVHYWVFFEIFTNFVKFHFICYWAIFQDCTWPNIKDVI